MIHITEKTTKKIPGESSLFVSFDYKKELVAILKTCTPFHFHTKDKIWEIPTTRLAKFVNQACLYDEIDLKLKKTKIQSDIKYPLSKFKTKPYQYQEDGIQFGLNHDSFLLLDAPGLGKTLQMIYLAEELKRQRGIQHCLIVCGINTLKTNWEKEINKHSKLKCTILGKKVTRGGKVWFDGNKARVNQLKTKINEFFIITNIESLREDEFLKALKTGPNKIDMVVVDEVHTCKSHLSQQGQNLLKLTSPKYKIGLTGTPILNSPLDAYVPLKWIGVERASYTNFRYQYCVYGGQFSNELVGYKNMDTLKDIIAKHSLRRTKDLLDLPEKTIIDEFLDMPTNQAKFYDNLHNGIVEEIDKVHVSTKNLLAMIARLRQATACPAILTTSNIDSVKIDRCCELIEEIVSNGDKVVVFSTFKETLNQLYQKLQNYNPLLCHGDVPDQEVSDNIDKFQQNAENMVMLCTHAKMGVGVTLTAANYAIFIDQPWTDGAYEQCCDRIHRIGSKKPVFIYNLICNNTFDMRVHQIVKNKEAIGNFIVDNIIDANSLEILKQYIKDL